MQLQVDDTTHNCAAFFDFFLECPSRNYISGMLEYRPEDPIQAKKAGFKDKHKGTRVDWRESKGPLTRQALEYLYLDPNWVIGKRFGKHTNYIVADVDIGSSLHPNSNPKGLDPLYEKMESIGLARYLQYQSSDSGGLHIIWPLPGHYSAWAVAQLAQDVVQPVCALVNAELELFPNVCSQGVDGRYSKYNGIRLPLQYGSYLLDELGYPVTNSPAEFMRQLKNAQAGQYSETFEEQISRYLKSKLKNKKAPERQSAFKLQWLIDRGWTDESQTNQILGAIAAYCCECLNLTVVEDITAQIVQMAERLPGYEEYCHHKHEIWKRARDWAKCALKKWRRGSSKSATSAKPKKPNHNDRLAADSVNKITQTIKQVENEQFPTTRALLNRLREVSGCAKATLYKYRYLWDHLAPHQYSKACQSEELDHQPVRIKEVFATLITLIGYQLSLEVMLRVQIMDLNSSCVRLVDLGIERTQQIDMTSVLYLLTYKWVKPPYSFMEIAVDQLPRSA